MDETAELDVDVTAAAAVGATAADVVVGLPLPAFDMGVDPVELGTFASAEDVTFGETVEVDTCDEEVFAPVAAFAVVTAADVETADATAAACTAGRVTEVDVIV